ncbi:MAG: 4Fe-4S binding protein [Actinobacteria bacterium]|nr:4Fe-4S binding protein [Actinomycetota bacterium]
MAKRKIINIDESKCTGCGLCVPSCPEGALQIIDGKARLISDLFCDGLGACIGECPEGAITIEEREAEPYDERKVMENIVKQGKNVIKAHLKHLKDHNQTVFYQQALEYLEEKEIDNPEEDSAQKYSSDKYETIKSFSGCPGSRVIDLREEKDITMRSGKTDSAGISQLKQWPVQIMLVPVNAPYFKDANLLISADCVPFAYADFHRDFLKGRILLVGCPKLDDTEFYRDKITEILKNNNINSITVIHMEVPCCFGMVKLVEEAVKASGKNIPLRNIEVSIKGNIK